MQKHSVGDNISLQRQQDGGQLSLLSRRNAVFVERFPEVLHEGIKIGVANAEAAMRSPHAAAAVAARTAARLADLLNEQTLETGYVCVAKELIDTAILRNILDKVLDDEPDGRLSSKPAIERPVVHRCVRGRTHEQDRSYASCYADFHIDDLR
jgi:hypothetical protein